MPKFYCDYCDVFLTNDSISVRKLHYAGWKHKTNVRAFYAQFVDDPTSALMVSTQTSTQQPMNPNMMLMSSTIQQQQQEAGVSSGSATTLGGTSAIPLILDGNSYLVMNTANQTTTPGQQPILMGFPIIPMPRMIMLPSATQQSSNAPPSTSLNQTTMTSLAQMHKTPEMARPPYHVESSEFRPPFMLPSQQEDIKSSSIHSTTSFTTTTTATQPPLFLFPPPPPPHLVNLCPNIPLTGSYQQTAPSPPFPFVLQNQLKM